MRWLHLPQCGKKRIFGEVELVLDIQLSSEVPSFVLPEFNVAEVGRPSSLV